MRGTRVKQLRKEAYSVYMQNYKRLGRRMMPFKSIFRQVKKLYNAGLPIFTTPTRIAWPTK